MAIHDIAIQNCLFYFAIDRGGIVGADGQTHQGAFDLSFLRCIPNMVIMVPSDENGVSPNASHGLSLPRWPCCSTLPKRL